MDENENKEVKKDVKKKTIKVYQLLLIIILIIVIAVCGFNIYATNSGYDNVIALVKGEKKEEEASSQKENKTNKEDKKNDEKKKENLEYDGIYKRGKKDISNDYVVSDNCNYLIIEGNEIYFSADKSNKMLEGTYNVNSKNEIEYKLKKDTQDFAFYTASSYKFEIIDGKLNIVVYGTEAGTIYYEKIDNDSANNKTQTKSETIEEANVTNAVNKAGKVGEITYNDLTPATDFSNNFNVIIENSNVYFELLNKEYFEKYFITNSDINRIENQKEAITGFNGEVEKVYFYSDGQALTERNSAILFLMKDGSVEYISLADALQTTDLKSRGEITGLYNIKEIYSASARDLVDETGGPGWRACLAKDTDNNYYDLKTVFEKNNIDLSEIN